MRLRSKVTKKCPRCGNKCLINQSKCEECGLLFERLQYTSNKAAKKKLAKFDRDFIIYTNKYPKDMQYWKLLVYSIFLGLFGGHYYYCGKYIKGGLMTAGFVYTVFCTIFNAYLVNLIENFLFLPIGIYALAWLYSLAMIIIRKFKVPVIVEMPEDKNTIIVESASVSRDDSGVKNKTRKNKNKSSKKQAEDVDVTAQSETAAEGEK